MPTLFLSIKRKPTSMAQEDFGAKLAKKYGGEDKGGARGCYCTMKFAKKADLEKAILAMAADGFHAWDEREQATLAAQALWSNLLANKGYEDAVIAMKKFLPNMRANSFRIPEKA